MCKVQLSWFNARHLNIIVVIMVIIMDICIIISINAHSTHMHDNSAQKATK